VHAHPDGILRESFRKHDRKFSPGPYERPHVFRTLPYGVSCDLIQSFCLHRGGQGAAEDGHSGGDTPMQYRLKFIDSFEDTVRALNIEAADDDSTIYYSSTQSIYFNMPVELWCEDNLVVRMTPMTARLYLPEDEPLRRVL